MRYDIQQKGAKKGIRKQKKEHKRINRKRERNGHTNKTENEYSGQKILEFETWKLKFDGKGVGINREKYTADLLDTITSKLYTHESIGMRIK